MIPKLIINIFLTLLVLIISLPAAARPTGENPDFMRSNGLLFVVLGVLVIIFIGLMAYLFVIDKKISKFEQTLNDNV